MPEPTTIALALASKASPAIKWAWTHQDEIEPRLKKLYRASKRGLFGKSPGILVLGAGGTGKTTLGRILSGRYNFLFDVDLPYEQSIAVQTFRSSKKPDVELVVAPGQEDRRHATWPSLLKRLAVGKELGIILCCSYGYHALTTSFRYHRVYNKKSEKMFLPNFLADRQAEEIRILESIIASLEQNTRPTWPMTLVGKQDLWCRDEQEVYDFYTTGAYGVAIQELGKRKGIHLFRHELVFGSLVIRNFATGRSEHLKSNAAGYDRADQVQSLRRILETVAALEQWKVN